jgi:Bacterial sugar transferase
MVRPGITGWAQVHGGKLITPEEKNALDAWYVRNASWWLDLKIIGKTIVFMLVGEQRYAPVDFDGTLIEAPAQPAVVVVSLSDRSNSISRSISHDNTRRHISWRDFD